MDGNESKARRCAGDDDFPQGPSGSFFLRAFRAQHFPATWEPVRQRKCDRIRDLVGAGALDPAAPSRRGRFLRHGSFRQRQLGAVGKLDEPAENLRFARYRGPSFDHQFGPDRKPARQTACIIRHGTLQARDPEKCKQQYPANWRVLPMHPAVTMCTPCNRLPLLAGYHRYPQVQASYAALLIQLGPPRGTRPDVVRNHPNF